MKEKIESLTMSRRQFLATTVAGSAMLASSVIGFAGFAQGAPSFELFPLPYPEDALAPYLSSRTLSFHYGNRGVL